MHVRSSLVKLGTSVYTCATCSVWPYAAPQPPLQARWLGPVLVSRARLPCRQRAGWCGAPPLNCCARAPTSERAAQAVCLVVRNQHADIREWLEHHLALGAGRFYVFDNNSTAPMLDAVLDLVQAGVVEYHYLTAFRHRSNKRAPGPPAAHGGSGTARPVLLRRPCAVSRPSPCHVRDVRSVNCRGEGRRMAVPPQAAAVRVRHVHSAVPRAPPLDGLHRRGRVLRAARRARAGPARAAGRVRAVRRACCQLAGARRAPCPAHAHAPAPLWRCSVRWSSGGRPRSRRAAYRIEAPAPRKLRAARARLWC